MLWHYPRRVLTRVSRGAAAGRSAAGEREVAAVARGGAANLAGAAVSAVANFLVVVVVARFLSPSAAGAFFGVTSLFLIVETIVRLGSDTGAVYFVSRWRALGTPERIRPALRAAAGPVLAASVAVGALMVVLAPWLADLVSDGTARTRGEVRLLAVLVPVAVLYDVFCAATRGFARMRTSVVLEKLLRPLLQVALVVAVLVAGWDGWLAAAWGVPYVLVVVLAARALRRLCAPLPAHDLAPRAVAREFWSFALPRAVAGVAQIVLQRLDIVLVAALRGPGEAAVYTAASRFLVLGQFFSQAIAAPVQPRLSAALADHDTGRARGLYRVSTTWIVLVAWPTFLVAAVFAPEYLSAFGHDYRSTAAIAVVVLLAASMLVATGVGVVDSVIIMAGRTSWNLATTLLAVAVNVGVDVVLVPPFGIVGAAVGWCAAILASNVVPLVVAWKGLGLHPFGGASALAGAAALAAFGVLPFAGRLAAGLPGAIAGVVVGLAGYVVVVHRHRVALDLAGLLSQRPLRRRRAAAA